MLFHENIALVVATLLGPCLSNCFVLAVEERQSPSFHHIRTSSKRLSSESAHPQIKRRPATTHSKRQCTTCQFPQHSWKTFPVSFHSGRPDTHGPTGLEWLPEDLEALARYPLVTLEKWHGSKAFSTDLCQQTGKCSTPSNVFYWEQDAWISAARQLKAKNPNISVAVW
jgi:hypothetical protein